jgi:potassium/chloride transporter 8
MEEEDVSQRAVVSTTERRESEVGAPEQDDGDLFQQSESDQKPWWKTNFFVREPVLFGTWDGVFTSCVINVFGVIIFLRTGFMVGYAGTGLSFLIICLTLGIAVITILSATGLCDKCPLGPGGIYFVLSHVLGGRLGFVIGTLYTFGQAVSISLFATGLGEAVSSTFDWETAWAVRGIGLLTALLLFVIVLVGVKFVIRLQLLLLLVLLMSALDFIIGSFAHTDEDAGFFGYQTKLWKENAGPSFSDESFFTVFGVFLPTATGMMAGLNMSGDLRHPKINIPAGTVCGVIVSGSLYLLFALILGATCRHHELQTDYMIASKVSLVGAFFIAGLFVASCSTILGAMFQAPRVFQSIARDNPESSILRVFALGRGPNKEPVAGVILVFVIAVLFLLVGHVNALSPIVVMPFLLTYAAINYAYFALAMSPREGRCAYERLVNEEVTNEVLEEDSEQSVNTDQMEEEPMELADSQEICYGYQSTTITEQLPHTTSLIVAEDENMRQMRSHATQSRAKEVTPPIGHPDTRIKLFPKSGIGVYRQPNSLTGLFQSCDDSTSIHSKVNSEPNDQVSCHWTHRLKFWKRTRQKGDDEPVVSSKISRVVSRLVNRWISLAGALISVLIMFLIHWGYALASLTAGCLLYIYIAKASQGLPPGFYHSHLLL